MAVDLATFDPQLIAANVPGLQVGARCGGGGQKAVWASTYLGATYVLKIMVGDPDSTERAKRELEVYRRCNSTYLPKLGPLPLSAYAVGSDVVLYYLEELIPGSTLEQTAKPMLVGDVVAMAKCVTDAIEELWKNKFVHRDIKPANIMQRLNTSDSVLLDAGLALDAIGPSLTNTGGIVGTVGYLSPDQLQLNKRDLDFRSDLFGLGICMYVCSTNEHPFWNLDLPRGHVHHNTVTFPSPSPQRWNATLRPDFCDFVMRLLEKERHLRYSRFDLLRDDLNRIAI
jgi:serine/threonine protein kinase